MVCNGRATNSSFAEVVLAVEPLYHCLVPHVFGGQQATAHLLVVDEVSVELGSRVATFFGVGAVKLVLQSEQRSFHLMALSRVGVSSSATFSRNLGWM